MTIYIIDYFSSPDIKIFSFKQILFSYYYAINSDSFISYSRKNKQQNFITFYTRVLYERIEMKDWKSADKREIKAHMSEGEKMEKMLQKNWLFFKKLYQIIMFTMYRFISLFSPSPQKIVYRRLSNYVKMIWFKLAISPIFCFKLNMHLKLYTYMYIRQESKNCTELKWDAWQIYD